MSLSGAQMAAALEAAKNALVAAEVAKDDAEEALAAAQAAWSQLLNQVNNYNPPA